MADLETAAAMPVKIHIRRDGDFVTVVPMAGGQVEGIVIAVESHAEATNIAEIMAWCSGWPIVDETAHG